MSSLFTPVDTPSIPETTTEKEPTKQTAKDTTAATSEAASAQKDKASKHRGLAASILTDQSGSTSSGKETLG